MSAMEPAALVAPVTALEFIQDQYLLAGEGPLLTVYSLWPRPKACTSLSVLQHYRIHGIRPRIHSAVRPQNNKKEEGLTPSTESTVYDLVVFGGKAVRLVRLHVDQQHLEARGPLVELQDWALDVRWLSGDGPPLLCVALAHNRALLLDANTRTPLFQRSCVEGCLLYSTLLLVHQSWADTVLVGGTVFNQLVLWKPGEEGGGSEHKAPVQRRLLGHSGVIFSVSYLQDEGCLASASDDRSVRVWGVGALGGPGGSCGDPDPVCLRVLYGHQARVFSVRLAPGQVFSAGEDGACLVWDGGRVIRTLKGHRAGGVRALAVSDGTVDEDRWVATGGADGGVRVWRVEANDDRMGKVEETAEKLTDLKFSGDGVPKVVCPADEDDSDWSQSGFVVCTDLGSVYRYRNGLWGLVWRGPSDFQSYCVMETVSVRVKSSWVQICAVGNLSGSVFVFPVSHPQSGILLNAGSGKIHSIIWQKDEGGGFLLASGAEGRVHRWCVQVTSGESCHLVLSALPLPGFLLPLCVKRWLTGAVRVRSGPQGALWVCGDRRGSLLLFQEKDESNTDDEEKERMEVTKGGLTLEPTSVLFGVHGKQGVTAVTACAGLFYSTGRDGCVRVFRVRQTKPDHRENKNSSRGAASGLQLEVLRVQRACKGMEWLDRVLVLEPETTEEEEEEEEEEGMMDNLDEGTFKAEDHRVRETRFVMAGFHGVHFVVWDPVKQERLLAVPCGGGHRSWTLWPSLKGVWPGYGALVFIKQGALMASQPPGPTRTGTTGWTLRDGVHGRGVGCVRRLGRVGPPEGLWEVAVTGGEDTSVAVLAVRPDSGAVRVLAVLTDHISSVRTLMAVTRPGGGADGDGTPSLSAVLVSAGGRAQMQCYRLLIGWDRQRAAPSCQVIQVARHRLDEQWERKRDRHKMVKMDPETRYMSVAVVEEGTDGVVVALGCSDGAVRLFSICETKHRIDLLWESFHHQRCVLSVATCSLEDAEGNRVLLLFSASTDGQVSVWDLPPPSSSQTPPLPCLSFPAHQSGVNALAVWTEEDEGGCLVTVASGGDDGQLTVSVMRVQFPHEASRGTSSTSEPLNRIQVRLRSQARVPLAHAAPLTALQTVRPGLLVSTSSDQRVCLWRVGGTGVVHRGAVCSHVADAAALSVWEGDGDPRRERERRTGAETIRETDERTEEEGEGEGEGLGDEDKGGGGATETETGDPVNETRDGQSGNQSQRDHKRGTDEDRVDQVDRVDWVLVCGQGVQLLRLRQTNT
ncbi:LOW QUALITY PROTEIN: tRNA (34-2'-O)-methyltransferase regulator WDR6 [Sphaeramia orbicularis]|uniref:LOW QUALITY PROTEIN: tRNA (34-2'-O)-methyltransferase regulator WDR6 n=1 Tax=Sphaeramia orbicularis TaxID=375764 RepID=UPI00117E3E92|nr:LOW QUALITY PROTEIN: WD repeat-containing protein 6 [Sphaeramia orbicularis]